MPQQGFHEAVCLGIDLWEESSIFFAVLAQLFDCGKNFDGLLRNVGRIFRRTYRRTFALRKPTSSIDEVGNTNMDLPKLLMSTLA